MTANRWLNTFQIMGALGAREKEHALIDWLAERRRVAIGFRSGSLNVLGVVEGDAAISGH